MPKKNTKETISVEIPQLNTKLNILKESGDVQHEKLDILNSKIQSIMEVIIDIEKAAFMKYVMLEAICDVLSIDVPSTVNGVCESLGRKIEMPNVSRPPGWVVRKKVKGDA
jgi:hypothetical protein